MRPSVTVAALVLALSSSVSSCGGGTGEAPDRPGTASPATRTPQPGQATATPPASPTPTGQPCSSDQLPAELEPQPGLPEPVAATRRALYDAALRCDYARLGELAPDDEFTYSFGDDHDPASHWRRAEAGADEDAPMRYLAGLLRLPHGEIDVQGQSVYSWPAAFAHDSWSQVPQQQREALTPLYDEDDFADFAMFGAYIGYRVLIAEDGTWRAFVAGD